MLAAGGVVWLLLAIAFAYHAYNTGRQFWVFVILMLPVAGIIAYVLSELLPDFASSRKVRAVASDIGTVLDPDRTYRERLQQVELTGTTDAKRQLASECEQRGMWNQAAQLYRSAATGAFAADSILLTGLARAYLHMEDPKSAQETLDRLVASEGPLTGHEPRLLQARIFEALGRLAEARAAYEALVPSYPGPEAKARYGLLLQRLGEVRRARAVFEDIVARGRAARQLHRDDRDWVEVARRNVEARV